jgi:hypothetical protein
MQQVRKKQLVPPRSQHTARCSKIAAKNVPSRRRYRLKIIALKVVKAVWFARLSTPSGSRQAILIHSRNNALTGRTGRVNVHRENAHDITRHKRIFIGTISNRFWHGPYCTLEAHEMTPVAPQPEYISKALDEIRAARRLLKNPRASWVNIDTFLEKACIILIEGDTP